MPLIRPEDHVADRPIRTVQCTSSQVIFSESDQPALVLGQNDRGDFEVLIAPDRKDQVLSLLEGGDPCSLTGFWRRRSGTRPDGSRRYVWCLVLLNAELSDQEELPIAA